ncbi:hypothetical protein BANRA_01677 [Acinetobacter baumannii]|nr:hypothetical protein BANRA_01677 [Acinetobacter baumannii]VCX45220.1 hypothetical protein BANRA_01462 [Acinetobacter baumannii]
MCANYEPINKDRVHLLDLFEPTFDYKNGVYPGYDCPLIFKYKRTNTFYKSKRPLNPTFSNSLIPR